MTVDATDRILLSSPDVGPLEREALLRAFDSGWVAPVGPELDAFEADLATLTGWPGTVAMSSGTAALHLALLAHGVGPGDEVLVSSFTFAATANAVTYTGATPKFVDSETASWNIDPQLLDDELAAADAAGRLPAAVVAVDLYGQCADYDAIVPLCARYGVPLVEDAAEALGSTHGGRAAGTLGDIGILSFNGNKIITTSGGGALLSPDPAVADRARYLATQARQPAVHYEHTDVGFNYRLSNLLAAMGRAQLERLPAMSARRLAINSHYRARAGRRRRSRLHADRAVVRSGRGRALERLADVRDLRRPGAARPGAGRIVLSRHREPAAVEADAPAAGVRVGAGTGERHQRAPLRPRLVPAERQRAHRRPGRAGRVGDPRGLTPASIGLSRKVVSASHAARPRRSALGERVVSVIRAA